MRVLSRALATCGTVVLQGIVSWEATIMKNLSALYLAVLVGTTALTVPTAFAQQVPGVAVVASDLGGVVTSPSGPEAGVWVIAETRDLPTKLVKIVVTDDRGRYVLPELPK